MFLRMLKLREYELHLLAFTLFCSHKIVYFLLYLVKK